MENKTADNSLWEARITISFKKTKLKLTILVLETTKERAEDKAIEWGEKYVKDNRASISKRIGYDAFPIVEPRAQAFRTSYAAVI
jgi:hypothetical protein